MQANPLAVDVSPQQLDRYARLVYEKIGVTISPQKITLLSNRLRRRLRARGLDCYDAYYELLRRSPMADPEWEEFLQEITTHETYLFRDKLHWDWLRDTFVAELRAEQRAGTRRPTLRVWSAACSTGDEAATIGCCLVDRLPSDWKIDILGTDVGSRAVEQARQATFGVRAMQLVPETYIRRFFEASDDGKSHTLKPAISGLMRFRVHNLLQPLHESQFDLIVLKNVLIYFDGASKRRVIDQVRRALRPGGILITGASDGASEFLKDFESKHAWLHRLPVTA